MSRTDNAQAQQSMPKDEKEWQEKLTPEQYRILREAGTEAPFSSPILQEKRTGAYVCVACEAELFISNQKFDSGTGWPSFTDAIPGAVNTKIDYKTGYPRTEYHCAHCGGHLGHVFEDGPSESGLRYCNNGTALRFVPDDTTEE